MEKKEKKTDTSKYLIHSKQGSTNNGVTLQGMIKEMQKGNKQKDKNK